MLRRVALLLVAGFTIGACENLSQLEYDAKVQDCFVIERVEDKKLITSDGYNLNLLGKDLDDKLTKGKTACGNYVRHGYFKVEHIGEDAERVKEFQEYLKELELESVKQSIKK